MPRHPIYGEELGLVRSEPAMYRMNFNNLFNTVTCSLL